MDAGSAKTSDGGDASAAEPPAAAARPRLTLQPKQSGDLEGPAKPKVCAQCREVQTPWCMQSAVLSAHVRWEESCQTSCKPPPGPPATCSGPENARVLGARRGTVHHPHSVALQANPFGSAKPVDTSSKLKEFEERIAKEKVGGLFAALSSLQQWHLHGMCVWRGRAHTALIAQQLKPAGAGHHLCRSAAARASCCRSAGAMCVVHSSALVLPCLLGLGARCIPHLLPHAARQPVEKCCCNPQH